MISVRSCTTYRIGKVAMAKTVAKECIKSPVDTVCEPCGTEIHVGDWVFEVSEDDYSYFVHEGCAG